MQTTFQESMTASPRYLWIDNPAAAGDLVAALPNQAIALDTEFMRTQTYFADLALIQLRCGEILALVDPTVPGVLDELRPMMAHPGDKILHSASEDVEVLLRALGTAPTPLFDTQVAATLCGAAFPPSYQKLVSSELGLELAKGATRSDWLQRPLTADQCEYAADDVRYLPALYARLHQRLSDLDRLAWLFEEGERVALKASEEDRNPHLKVRSAERLPAPQQRRLWRLLTWREQQARSRNRPRTWILDNAIAQRVATLDKPTPAALAAACTIEGRAQPRLAEKLEPLLAAPASDAELAIPILCVLSDAEKARAAELRKHIESRSAALAMSADFLLPRRGVEYWARHGELPAEFRGWRETALC